MSIEAPHPQPTALHKALKAAALDAYGSLLSGPLADKAATTFADEASALLEGMIADHTQVLRERIEAQLSGISLGKGAKRKGPPPKTVTTNGVIGSNGVAAPPVEADEAPEHGPTEAKAAKAPEARPAKGADAKSRPRKKAGGRSNARA